MITRGVAIEINSVSSILYNFAFPKERIIYDNIRQIFVVLYISFSGAYFIPLIFDLVYEKIGYYPLMLNDILKVNEGPKSCAFIDEVKTGKWIGIFERVMIMIFLFSNQLSSIGFVIAAKSLARFKLLENKIFAEYYLLGTLFSVVYSFVWYGIFQKIL